MRQSLRKTESFRTVYRKGRRLYGDKLHLFLLNNGTETTRLGVVITKKNGNSVVRHRFVRLVREVFRLHAQSITGGYDIVVAANKDHRIIRAKEIGYRQIEEALLPLLKKARIYR